MDELPSITVPTTKVMGLFLGLPPTDKSMGWRGCFGEWKANTLTRSYSHPFLAASDDTEFSYFA